MKTPAVACTILLLLAGNVRGEGLPQPVTLSLAKAIEMALSKNLDLRVEASNTEMSRTDIGRARGIYNPVLGVSGSGGITAIPGDPFFSTRTANGTVSLQENLPIGGSITAFSQVGYTNVNIDISGSVTKDWQSSAGVTMTVPLLKNAGKEATEQNITVASNNLHDSLEHFRGTVIDTVSSVITSYNHLYVLRQTQLAREASLKSAQNLLEEIKKRKATAALSMEVANAEFAIAQRRKDFIESIRNVRDQEENFRYLIGLAEKSTLLPEAPPSRVEPTETDVQAEKNALESRSDLQQLKLALQTSQLQERVARRATLPDLSVTAGGGATSTGVNFGDSFRQLGNHPGSYWNTGLQFSYPLGNAAAQNDYRKNKIKTEQVQDQIRALSWKIKNDVQSDMRALISARLQLQYADKAKEIADQRLEEYRKHNRLGTANATVQDVLNAENDQFTAQTTQLEALESFSNGVVKLWKDTGVLLERQGIHLDATKPEQLTSQPTR